MEYKKSRQIKSVMPLTVAIPQQFDNILLGKLKSKSHKGIIKVSTVKSQSFNDSNFCMSRTFFLMIL